MLRDLALDKDQNISGGYEPTYVDTTQIKEEQEKKAQLA